MCDKMSILQKNTTTQCGDKDLGFRWQHPFTKIFFIKFLLEDDTSDSTVLYPQ